MLVNIGRVTKPSEQKQYTNIGRVSDEAQKRISGMNINLPTLKEMFDNPQQSFSEAAKGNPIPSVYPTKGLIGNNQTNMSLADRLNAGNSSAADKALLKMLSGNALTDTERASIENGGLSSLLQNSSQLIDFSAPNNPANVKFTNQLKTLADKEMSGKKLTKQEQDMLETAQLWVRLQKSSAQGLASLTDDTALNAYKSDITGAIDRYDRTAYGKNTDTPEGAVLKGLDRAELYIGTGVTNYMQGVANTINLIAGASGDEIAGSNTPYAAASGALRDYFEKNGEKANIMLQDIVTNIAQNAVPMAASILTGGLGGGTAAARAASMAAFAPSVFGNAYKQGLEYGITDNRRLIPYALANTVLEVGLESLLSAKYTPASGILSGKVIEQLAGKTSSAVLKAFLKLGGNMVGEFTEESLQSILDPLLAKYMLGADVSTVADDPFGALSQAAYEGFIGALSAALMGGAGAVGESVSEASLQNYGKQFNALMRATGTDVKNVAQYYAETSKDGRLTNAAQKVVKGDTSDLAVGEMRAMADEYSKDARKAVFTEIGKSVKASENGVNDILTLYEESVKGGLIFPARVDELYNEVNAFKENAEPETLGEFVYSVQAYAPKALILGTAARRINAEQPVDSGENAGYNSNIRGEDNGVYQDGRTAQNERELEEAGYEDAGGNREDARAWGESEEAFAARAQRNANKAGRGKRVLLKHGSGSLAYTEKSADNTQASRAAERLKSAGVKAVYCDGDIETNENGVTTRHSEAITAPDGTVYISSRATLSDLDIASHELVHSEERKGAQAYTDYENIICENLLFNSQAYKDFCAWINENHYGGKYDIEDVSSANNFIREIAAYVNEFTITEPSRVDSVFSGMFEDWGAVKAAAEKFNRDTGADFTESAFLAPEADNLAELPDGVRSETVTLTRDGKRRRHLNRAEQEYVKKIAGLFGVDVVFENVREKTGIVADSYYDGSNNIHMDFSVSDPLNILIKHELTHFGEESREYNDFVRLVKDSKAFRDWINSKISGEKNISAKSAQYRQQIMDRYENAGEKLTVTGADGEMTANFVADTLFTDNGSGLDALIRQAEAKDRPVLIQWVIDFVKSVKSLFRGQYVPPEVLRLERKYVQMLKDAQSTERQKNTAENGGEKFSINSDFAEQYDKWDKKRGNRSFIIGNTSDVLKSLGVRASDISWDASKILKIKRNHPAMTDEVIKQVPNILENPVLVMKSKTVDGRLTLFGEVYDSNNAPVLAVLELNPTSAKGKELNLIKVASAYGKDVALQNFINTSEIVYTDKKRIGNWLKLNRLKLPLVNRTDSINSISENSENVNSNKNKFSISEDQASLLDRYDSGEISRQEYLEESNKNWQRAAKEYGTIEAGENPIDDIPVPKSVDGNKKTRRFARTMVESGRLTDRMLEDVGTAVLLGDFSYKVSSDDAAQKHADRAVKNGTAEQEWQRTVSNARKISKNNIAVGEKLLVKAIKEHDTRRVLELSSELADIMTRAGQEVQAARLLKKMTGSGRLVTIQRYINTMNNDLKVRYGENAPIIKLDPLIAEQLADTQPGENIENIYIEALDDVAAQVPVTWLDKANAWRYFAMLCGPRTHIRNLAGNTVFGTEVYLKNIIGTGLEHIFIRNANQRTKAIRVKKEYRDFAKGLARRGDIREMLSGSGQLDDKGKINQMRRIFKTEWLENLTKGNSNLLEAEDMLFKNLHFRTAVAGFLQARKVNINSISEETLAEAITYGINEAKKATFQDASALANYLNGIRIPNKGDASSVERAVKIAEKMAVESTLPFKRTPINIVKRGVEYSPLGLIKAGFEINDYVKGKITLSELLDTFAAVASGSTFMLLGMFLYAIGAVQGGFGDDNEDKFKKLNGEQEYSVNILGHTYTIDWAAPASIPFFVGAELMEEIAEGDGFQFRDVTESFWNTLEPITNLSMLQGIQSLIQSVKYEDSSRTFGTIMGDAATSYATQFIPALFGATARTIDETQRMWYTDKNSPLDDFTQSAIQNIISKIPGATYFQAPAIDEWGREKSRGGIGERVIENFISPGYYSEADYDSVDSEIQRIAEKTGESGVYPKAAGKSFSVDGETKYLTADEYVKYAKAKGTYSYDYVKEFFESNAYKRLTDEERAEVIKNLYKYANAKAKAEVSDYDITKSFKTVSQWEKNGRSPVIYYISLAIK